MTTPKSEPKTQKRCPVPQQSGSITQTSPGTEQGGGQDETRRNTPNPDPKTQKR